MPALTVQTGPPDWPADCPGWSAALAAEAGRDYMAPLRRFVAGERRRTAVFPPPERTHAALAATPPDRVRVVLLGQDPYHGPGQADGLCFSVPEGIPLPPSLRNVFRELEADLGIPQPRKGDLSAWARQGVLLLNTVLTVRGGQAGAHRGQGWEQWTDAVLRAVLRGRRRCVFLLWGRDAQEKLKLLQGTGHVAVLAAHPSPLSARRGFLGSRPFSRANAALRAAGLLEIDWRVD